MNVPHEGRAPAAEPGHAPKAQTGKEPSLIPCAEVVRALREAGARTDSSCGIHIHVGFGRHTPQSLRRLVNIVNSGHHCHLGSAGYAPSMQALTVASRA